MRNLARNFASAVLLLLVIPVTMGGVFELNNHQDGPHFFGATVFTLAAQLIVVSAGFAASPREGKVGVARAIGYTYLLVQTVALPTALGGAAYVKLKGGTFELADTKQLIGMLVGSSSAFVLVLVLAKPWRLVKGRLATTN